MEWLGYLLAAIVLGVVIGGLARLLLPGRQRVGLLLTIVIGAAAAYAGHFIAEAIGVASTDGIDWIKLAIQVVLAMVAVGALGGIGEN